MRYASATVSSGSSSVNCFTSIRSVSARRSRSASWAVWAEALTMRGLPMSAAVLAEQDRSPSADRPEMAVVAERRAAQEDQRLRNLLRPVSGATGEHQNLSLPADTDTDRAIARNCQVIEILLRR